MKAKTDTPDFDFIARHFRVLGEAQRLHILYLLQDKERSVGELAKALGTSQPNVSRHLAVLLGSGIVRRRRAGNLAYFSIAAPFIFELCDLMCEGVRAVSEDRAASSAPLGFQMPCAVAKEAT